MLKGKAKIDFEAWFEFRVEPKTEMEFYSGDSSGFMTLHLERFYKLPFAMQQGVYLEFFREARSIDISFIFARTTHIRGYKFYISKHTDKHDKYLHSPIADTRENIIPDYNTAFTHAIEKACDLWRGE